MSTSGTGDPHSGRRAAAGRDRVRAPAVLAQVGAQVGGDRGGQADRTALPICLAISILDPHQRKSRGTPGAAPPRRWVITRLTRRSARRVPLRVQVLALLGLEELGADRQRGLVPAHPAHDVGGAGRLLAPAARGAVRRAGRSGRRRGGRSRSGAATARAGGGRSAGPALERAGDGAPEELGVVAGSSVVPGCSGSPAIASRTVRHGCPVAPWRGRRQRDRARCASR